MRRGRRALVRWPRPRGGGRGGRRVALRRALALGPRPRSRACASTARPDRGGRDLVECSAPAPASSRRSRTSAWRSRNGLPADWARRRSARGGDLPPDARRATRGSWALRASPPRSAGDPRVVDLCSGVRTPKRWQHGVELRRHAAGARRQRLGDLERGVRLHAELFEAERRTTTSRRRSRRCTGERGNHRGLARLLGRLVDVTEQPSVARSFGFRRAPPARRARQPRRPGRRSRPCSTKAGGASALEELASLLEAASAHARLADVLERAVAAAGEPAREAALGFRLARLLDERLGEGERALAAYDRALELAPDDRDALARIADLAERRGDHTRAAAALERAAGLETDGAAAVAVGLRLADARVSARGRAGRRGGAGRRARTRREPSGTSAIACAHYRRTSAGTRSRGCTRETRSSCARRGFAWTPPVSSGRPSRQGARRCRRDGRPSRRRRRCPPT